MHPKFRVAVTTALAMLAGIAMGASAPPAVAQKGVLGFGANPSTGVVDPDGGFRYTAIGTGAGTLVAKVALTGGEVEHWAYLDDRLAVPAVAYDGSAGGLSADGETLVLPQPGLRFPQTRSEFTVLDAGRLRVLETVTLPGTFTFDALSPDGGTLYLIEYLSPRDLTEYQVRAYDIEQSRLDPSPILDPEESGDDMYGTPVTRATSPSGRWEYTLYDGAEYPFVHALNVQRGTAVCIDLDLLDGERRIDLVSLQPSLDGEALGVISRGEPVATVDLASFEVSEATPAASDPASAEGDQGSGPWLLIAGALAIVAGAGSFVTLRRRRARRIYHDELDRLETIDAIDDEISAETDLREREPVR